MHARSEAQRVRFLAWYLGREAARSANCAACAQRDHKDQQGMRCLRIMDRPGIRRPELQHLRSKPEQVVPDLGRRVRWPARVQWSLSRQRDAIRGRNARAPTWDDTRQDAAHVLSDRSGYGSAVFRRSPSGWHMDGELRSHLHATRAVAGEVDSVCRPRYYTIWLNTQRPVAGLPRKDWTSRSALSPIRHVGRSSRGWLQAKLPCRISPDRSG